jgi:hypothetical protein
VAKHILSKRGELRRSLAGVPLDHGESSIRRRPTSSVSIQIRGAGGV